MLMTNFINIEWLTREWLGNYMSYISGDLQWPNFWSHSINKIVVVFGTIDTGSFDPSHPLPQRSPRFQMLDIRWRKTMFYSSKSVHRVEILIFKDFTFPYDLLTKWKRTSLLLLLAMQCVSPQHELLNIDQLCHLKKCEAFKQYPIHIRLGAIGPGSFHTNPI